MRPPRRSRADLEAELARLRSLEADESDRSTLPHDVSVYQEELLVQNEMLVRAQAALEETRDAFIELYDFAPTPYLTMDENGIIGRCNLTALAFIGKSADVLKGLPLLGFVAPDMRRQYLQFLRRCRQEGVAGGVECELAMLVGNGRREVQLLCRRRPGGDRLGSYFVSIIDVTERNELERQYRKTAQEHEALATRLLEALDAERQRIARNLHDDIGQQLTAIRLKLDGILGSAHVTTDDVSLLHDMLATLDRRVHFVATELRPAALELGIVAAVDQFVRGWSDTFAIPAELHVQDVAQGMLSTEAETHLYRIVQEALNNVAKHANAGRVGALLEARLTEIALVVEDDGRGFDLEGARAGGSTLGIVGMRERAQRVGGRFQIETSPGAGTAVFVSIPRRERNA